MNNLIEDFKNFSDKCFVSNTEEIYKLCETKISNYLEKRNLKTTVLDLTDKNIVHFEIEQNYNMIRLIAKTKNSKDIVISKTELTNTPDKFKDVIINYEMFIIALIHCYRTIFFINKIEKKISIESFLEDYKLLLSFFKNNDDVMFLLNVKIGFADFKNNKIEIEKIQDDRNVEKIFLKNCTLESEMCLMIVNTINLVKYLQSLKHTFTFITKNYNDFL